MKLGLSSQISQNLAVRPLAGAGIEILLYWYRCNAEKLFAPSRGRELKFRGNHQVPKLNRSPPRGGGN